MDLSNLTKVTAYTITDKGFVFYDENGNVPDPKTAYWDGVLNLWDCKGKSLEGLPHIVIGDLRLNNYNGESLEGLPSVVVAYIYLSRYQGNDFNNLPKEYGKIYINDKVYTKSEMDDFWKTERLKRILLD